MSPPRLVLFTDRVRFGDTIPENCADSEQAAFMTHFEVESVVPSNLSRLRVKQRLCQMLPLGWFFSFSILALGCAPTPPVSSQATEPSAPLPPAPPVILSEEEVSDYARTVLTIEPIRQETFTQIQQVVSPGTLPPNFVCNQPDTVAQLPKKAQSIAVNYCTQAKAISQTNNLELSRFNEITASAASDEILRQEIQAELLRQQQQGFTR
ncbi:MAG: DUF4168 domain-containing protein [Desertifilum sp. SIO1I2]|nr:DUF4168 domain-containing protein [Desertifilum sp. SIO1I2]